MAPPQYLVRQIFDYHNIFQDRKALILLALCLKAPKSTPKSLKLFVLR